MSELYLICHKVRGEPAFDVATQVECAECVRDERDDMKSFDDSCPECDGTGFWWIIPTSGHRAYPYWHCELHECTATVGKSTKRIFIEDHPVPEGLPDHYPDRKSPTLDISSLFANLPKAPSKPIRRR